MNNSQIVPEKVTRPIQLLAAWLTGLVIIDGSFLITSTQIMSHPWASGALVIAAIVNVPLFLLSIFLLQTKFRPEMQEDAFYSKYLEQQYSVKSDIPKLPEIDEFSKTIAGKIIENLEPLSKGKTDIVEKILRDSQLEQITQRLGSTRTLSELYLSPNTWSTMVRKWGKDSGMKDDIENLLQEHLITVKNDDYETCKLTKLGLQVAQLAQDEGLLWQQSHQDFWRDEHTRKIPKAGG